MGALFTLMSQVYYLAKIIEQHFAEKTPRPLLDVVKGVLAVFSNNAMGTAGSVVETLKASEKCLSAFIFLSVIFPVTRTNGRRLASRTEFASRIVGL